MKRRNNHIRSSPELMEKINFVRAKCIIEGRKVPSIQQITKSIAKQIKEDLLWNEFIRFK